MRVSGVIGPFPLSPRPHLPVWKFLCEAVLLCRCLVCVCLRKGGGFLTCIREVQGRYFWGKNDE